MVAAVKHLMVRLRDHDREVAAIRKVVRQHIEVTYYRRRATNWHIYEPHDLMTDE